jgi:ribosomal-protein-alanine N-acetyltransferase
MASNNNEQFYIRCIEEEDLEDVIKLNNDSGFDSWKREDYQKIIDSKDLITLVALTNNESTVEVKKVVGFLLVRLLSVEGEILTFAVKKDFRRKKVASLLIDRLIIEAKLMGVESLFLEVRQSNIPAIKLYLAKGFRKLGLRPYYYTDPEEGAVLMILDIVSC